MSPPAFKHAAALLGTILKNTRQPADKQMESYFRQHRDLGVRDRGFVAETVYGCLRRRRFLEHVLNNDTAASPEAMVAAYALAVQGRSARNLEEIGFSDDVRTLAARIRSLDRARLPVPVRTDLPDWLAERLLAQFGEAETIALADALNRPASLDLRVNTLKATREQVQACLLQEDYTSEPTPFSPAGLRRHERTPLFKTKCFQQGWFEVQDEGSQLLSLLVEPKRHERIVDFCAGGGGKTLHLGALMANTGTLYAFDIAHSRLDKLKPRLKRAGLDTVRTQVIEHERDRRVRRLYGKIDRVLVDAPCSGTGTLRRNPDVKWRELNLSELVAVQQRILAAASELLKPGGRLVYATCSLLREENDAVVEQFLGGHPDFTILPAETILARRKIAIEIDISDPALRLYPHRHQTDGFYAIALKRSD